MSRSLQLSIGILFLLIAAVVYLKRGKEPTPSQQTPPASAEAQYDWVNIFDKQVKINNGGIVTVHIRNAPKVRIAMSAEDAVKMALIEGRQVDRNIVQAIDTGQANCSDARTTSVNRECDVPSGTGSLLLLYKDGSQPEQTLTIKVDAWQCKAGCP